MIKVFCQNNKIIYNAYHLTKAFFSSEVKSSEIVESQSDAILVEFDDERIVAGNIKELYEKLVDKTGRELPWGMLTGVRPTKLAAKWLREVGGTKSEFIKWFYEDRFVSKSKASMAFEIAEREKKVLLDTFGEKNGEAIIPGDSYSLYIGIPFCPTVCSYCSFSSGAISDYAGKVDNYLEALCGELKHVAEKYGPLSDKGIKPTTIYIGGGTPTSISAEQLDKLLNKVDEFFISAEGCGKIKEYTVEAGRPDSITREKLEVIKKHGVTRISINPQSMQQKTLDIIGRKHSVQDIVDAFHMARELGFDNINMDLIAGLPGETAADVADTLQKIKELEPDSLTVHSLAIKRASVMGMTAKTEKAELPNETPDISEMINEAYHAAIEMDMNPYYLYRQKSIAGNFENIGYAKTGKEGIYNILIMEEVQSIIACGAGASTKLVVEETENPNRHGQKTTLLRSENVKNIDEYISRQLNGIKQNI